MLPASQLNALRRDALEQLTQLRGRPRPHVFSPAPLPRTEGYRAAQPPYLRARLASAEQLTPPLMELVREASLPLAEPALLPEETTARYAGRLLAEIPGVIFGGLDKVKENLAAARRRGITDAVAGGLGGIGLALEHGFSPHGDYGLNITNSAAAEEYARLGLAGFTVSFELHRSQLLALGGELPRGALAYGYLPMMTLRNHPGGVRRSGRFPEVVDRRGSRFFVGYDWQVPRLYNCVPLVLSDCAGDFAGLDFLTLYFTRETPEQCAGIARLYRDGGVYTGERTRGLYYRKVK